MGEGQCPGESGEEAGKPSAGCFPPGRDCQVCCIAVGNDGYLLFFPDKGNANRLDAKGKEPDFARCRRTATPAGGAESGKKGNPPSCHNRAGWGIPVFMRCGEESLCGSPPPRRGGQDRSSPPPSPVPPPVLPPPGLPPGVLPPGLPPVPAEGALPM